MEIWMDVDTALSEVPVNVMPLVDDTDFKTIEASVAYNAAGMALKWNFVTTAGAMTQTAVTPTTAGDYDWTNQGNGMYTIEIPASGGASINNDTEGYGWFSGVATGVLPWRGPIIGFRAAGLNNLLVDDAFSATRGLAGTALPAAAADAAGGLPVSDAGGLDLDARIGTDIPAILVDTGTTLDGRLPAALVGGRMDASIGAVAAGAITAAAFAANALDAVWSTASRTLTSFGTLAADIWAAATRTLTAATNITSTGGTTVPQTGDSFARLGAPAGASVSADVAALQAVADAVLVDTGTDIPALLATIAGYIDTEVAAIKAKTDNLPADPASQTDVTTVGAAVTTVDTVVDAIKVVTDALTAAAAAKLALSAGTIVPGTVDTTGFAATTTEFEADDITEATADHYIGRIVIFTSGAMQYQAARITDYALATGRGHFTVSTMTEAPANDVTFVIV